MATMPITPTTLPTPPSRDDPANFATRGDAFLGALPTYQTELNSISTTNYNNTVESNTSATTATTKAAEAATSASNAATSATNAANSATASASSASTASTKASEAATSATNAATSETNAANSASDALASKNAAATSATNAANSAATAQVFATQQLKGSSSTSLAPSAGSKTLTIETNRSFVTGMYVVITSSGSPTNRMSGFITSYNMSTGELVVSVDSFSGSTTSTDWVVGVAGVPGSSSGLTAQRVTTNTTCVAGVEYIVAAAGISLTFPTSWSVDDKIAITEEIGGFASYTWVTGSTPVRGRTLGTVTVFANRATTGVLSYFNSTTGLK